MPRIYTRTGDKGMTSLVDGTRSKKNSIRIEAYGTVDELNSFVGVLIASDPLEDADREMLTEVQNVLFDLGGYLAAGSAEMSARLLPKLEGPTARLEAEIDRLDGALPRHNRFVLPQGTPAAAAAHVARTVARRAERRILDLADALADEARTGESAVQQSAAGQAAEAPLAPEVLGYINRLSDYLFVLARHSNMLSDRGEIFWG